MTVVAIPEDDRTGTFRANATIPVSEVHVRRSADAADALAELATAPQRLKTLAGCDGSGGTEDACAARIIDTFAAKAFRRPLTAEEKTSLQRVYQVGKETGPFAQAVALIVTAVFQSPQFLYHFETIESSKLTPFARAARLSYFLTGTLPDDTLWDAATQGQLSTASQFQAHVTRLLQSSTSDELLSDFVVEWLGIDGVDSLVKDKTLFPTFSVAMAKAMKTETASFARHIWKTPDASFATLLTGNFSIVPEVLLPLYGVSRAPNVDPAVPLSLPNTQRAGVLTQASFLAAQSFSDHTSPVKRGVYLLNAITCMDIHLPTGLAIPELPPINPTQTTRERFLMHEQPGCAGCHLPIDHLGFAYEKYDPIGAFRETENGKPVDDTGALHLGNPLSDGPAKGGVAMAQKLLAASETKACFAQQLFRFASRRPPTALDACSLASLREGFEASGLNIRQLAWALATNDVFLAP
jgi:hypothetical protein